MLIQNYITGQSSVNIARSVEEAVARGSARAGDLLPAVRAAALALGVSPATVAAAYRLLQERGVVVADGRRGTRIRQVTPVAPPVALALPDDVRNLSEGNPDPELLPDVAAAVRKLRYEPRLYHGDLNHPQMLELAREQFDRDHVEAKHVAVVSGALDGIERVLREQLRAGDRVAVEDPCFTGVLDLLNALSLTPVPVAIDDEGLLPDELQRALASAKAVIVTPRAQNPSGAALSLRRALQLRKLLAKKPDVLLIEDDHAGPIAGAQYLTLVRSERARWAVVRSVSKSLGPDVRLAVMAGDERTIARVEGRQTLGIRWVSHLLQALVCHLWSDRHVQQRLARAERLYTTRREMLIRELAARGIGAHGVSGLNVWIPVPEESAIVRGLFQKRWAVNAGERYRLSAPPAIRVTISTVTAQEATEFADDLASLLSPAQRRMSV